MGLNQPVFCFSTNIKRAIQIWKFTEIYSALFRQQSRWLGDFPVDSFSARIEGSKVPSFMTPWHVVHALLPITSAAKPLAVR